MSDPGPIAGPSSIPLYLINGVGTVWDAQTAATLHCQYEISGLRAGTLPGVSQQNGFLGLPLTLMQEETAYLVQQGIAHLVPVRSTPCLPSVDQITQQRDSRIAKITKLEQAAQEAADRAAEEARERFVKGGDKARVKREERARAKSAKKAEAVGEENLFEPQSDLSAPEVESVGSQKTTTRTAPTTDTSTSTSTRSKSNPLTSLGHFHTVPSHPAFLPLAAESPITSLPHPLFPFPSTPRHRATLNVFTTLLSLGLRLGLGPRFGGEYLVYPGDYLRYHAHFTSQVIVGEEAVKPTEIVAWGRLGTGTKKAGLICCVEGEEGEGEVSFYSLEWANFG